MLFLVMQNKQEIQEFAKRLNAICDEKGVPAKGSGRQLELAKRFGVGQTAARKWLEAETWPNWEKIIAIARWADVTIDWLITGRLPKRPIPAVGEDAPVYLTPRDRALLDNAQHLNEEERRALELMALRCAEAQHNKEVDNKDPPQERAA